MARNAEDCRFQMLNGVEIVTSVREESNPVDDETDEDEVNLRYFAPIWLFLQARFLHVMIFNTEKIELREDLKSRRGLAVSLEIICHNCGESTSTMSSKISNKCYVNLRLTYGMRAIGKGGAAARIFCGLMNLPPPPAKIQWGMECRGLLSIFQRSETSRKACYTQYLGDGDSKGFLTIKEAKVYGDTEVEKLECVGHVQKRMGTRRRNILKMSKGFKLSDGKNISGRGRLTLKEVDSIQHYYGLAIRKNLSSVEDMKRAI
ncbi:uncharacterized protein TNCV_3341291 [Trichonephila clavipes]|nr:uncharacterized protein TNCV_3341291 [Trichonephila clavipes]